MDTVTTLLQDNTYPGRGIITGFSPSGEAVLAYFIMGRSENSRNRIFREQDDTLQIQPFDPAKVKDPSLIIYTPVRTLGDSIIVTNGDQTDTIYETLRQGGSFRAALDTRYYEPDEPNYTPRISALLKPDSYQMSIVKCATIDDSCLRLYWNYPARPGIGHLIHTYDCDGDPLPSFCGSPRPVAIGPDAETFAADLWQALNADNRVSLYVRYVDYKTKTVTSRVKNRHLGD